MKRKMNNFLEVPQRQLDAIINQDEKIWKCLYMGQIEKIILKILVGKADTNIEFSELIRVMTHLGFEARIKGGHHIYYRNDIDDIINLQPDGNKAKPYQVKQVRNLILKYNLGGDIDV